MEMIKFECCHADTCLSDYWSGHHLPHVQIPVYRGMTLKDVKNAIRSELSQGAVMGSTDNARLLSADMVGEDEVKQADRVTRAAYAAVNRMRLADPRKRNLFMDLEESTDENDDRGDSVYAFFVFVVLED
jgi:hypothetical protein